MGRKFFALFAVLAIAALVAGCGSSDDNDSISKAEFVQQANAICKASEGKDEKEFEKFLEEEGASKNKPPSKELQEQAIEEIAVPGISKQLEEIRALGFPEGKDGEEAEAIVESAEGDLEEAEGEPSALFSGNLFKQTNKEARAYGLTVCGSES